MFSSMTRPYFTPGKDPYPLYRRLGGPQGRSGQAENLAPPGFFFLKLLLPSQPNTRLTKKKHFFASVFFYIIYAVSSFTMSSFAYTLRCFLTEALWGVTLSSFRTSSWVSMTVPCGPRLEGGVLSRVSIDNFPPVVSGWPPGMTSILLGA